MSKPPSAGKQLTIVGKKGLEEREWEGMPEFVLQNLEPVKSVTVHFARMEDYSEFARLVGQSMTPATKSIWFPKQRRFQHFETTRYADGETKR